MGRVTGFITTEDTEITEKDTGFTAKYI